MTNCWVVKISFLNCLAHFCWIYQTEYCSELCSEKLSTFCRSRNGNCVLEHCIERSVLLLGPLVSLLTGAASYSLLLLTLTHHHVVQPHHLSVSLLSYRNTIRDPFPRTHGICCLSSLILLIIHLVIMMKMVRTCSTILMCTCMFTWSVHVTESFCHW